MMRKTGILAVALLVVACGAGTARAGQILWIDDAFGNIGTVNVGTGHPRSSEIQASTLRTSRSTRTAICMGFRSHRCTQSTRIRGLPLLSATWAIL